MPSRNVNNENNSKWKWFIGPVVTLTLVFGGFVASWATTRTAVAEIQKDVQKIEQKTGSLENKIHGLEVRSAVKSSVLNNLQADIAEIKNDVKKILRKNK